MKLIIFFAAFGLLSLTYSCNMPAPASAGGMDAAYVNKIKGINDAIYRAIETGDVSKIDSSFATSNIVDHGMGAKDMVGRDSILSALSNIHKQFNNLKLEVLSESVDSNYSLAWVRMTGTSASPESGFPVGTPLDLLSVDVVKWVGGKASEHWSYNDPRDMMKMMAPQPAANKMDTTGHK